MQELHCKQCGLCCQKGGPLLHQEDAPLLQQGHISFSQVLTLRAGELAFDPVYNKLIPLEEEALKIQGTQEPTHPWHCVFHKPQGCGLHPLRPAQCKALFCTDTSELESMYHMERATRADIFSLQEGWLELAEAHEEQCPLHPLVGQAERLFENKLDYAEEEQELSQQILQTVRYDLAFRELCCEKAHLSPNLLPCILGRPVHNFLQSVGFEVRQNSAGQLELKKLAKAAYFS